MLALLTGTLDAGPQSIGPGSAQPAWLRAPDQEIPIPNGGGGGGLSAIGDVDGDGDLEILALTRGGILGWHHDGTPIPGRPLGLGGFLALADLDGDPLGDLEVICGDRLSFSAAQVGAFQTTDTDGTYGWDPVPGWPAVVTAPFPIMATSFPSVEDLDGDGSPEIAFSVELYDFPREHAHVHLFDAHGAEKPGAWPVLVQDKSFRYMSAAFGDLDGDGAREIVMKSVAEPTQVDYLHAWDVAGSEPSGYPTLDVSIGGFGSASSAVLGDLTGDGRMDVVTGITREVVAVDSGGSELFRFDVGSGTPMTPAFADLDDDGELEIVAGVYQGSSFFVVVLDHEGHLLARTQTLAGRAHWSLSALVGDLDGDGVQELIVPAPRSLRGSPSRIHVFDRDGSWRPDLTMVVPDEPYLSPHVQLGDLDGDGRVEVVAVGDQYVYIWKFRGSPADCDWPMFMHDARMSGRFE